MRGTAVTISHQYTRLGLIGSILVLVGIVALGGGVGYWLLTGMNYTWRWYRVPNYFYAFVEEKVFAERDGVVISVEKRGWRTQEIVIQEADTRQSYLITDAYLPLAEGYPITQGDLLGVRTTGQIGLLSRGLLLTLSVSAISLVGAVLIGGCGGVTLYAGLPPARWLLTGVTEILNDIPLLWHVLLWQFVVSPMLYLGLESLGVDISLSPWFAAIVLMYYVGGRMARIVAHELAVVASQNTSHGSVNIFIVALLPHIPTQWRALIKASSLLSLFAVRELTKATREAITITLQPFEMMLTGATLYVVLIVLSSACIRWCCRAVQHRLNIEAVQDTPILDDGDY